MTSISGHNRAQKSSSDSLDRRIRSARNRWTSSRSRTNELASAALSTRSAYTVRASTGERGEHGSAAGTTLAANGADHHWHGELTWLAGRWNSAADVAVVLGVGETIDTERSHFEAMDRLNRASHDRSERTGWLGRLNHTLDPHSGVRGISLNMAHDALAGPGGQGLAHRRWQLRPRQFHEHGARLGDYHLLR